MSSLINFPTEAVRDRRSFDKTVRKFLSKYTDFSPVAIDQLMARLLPVWDQYHQHEFDISISLPDTLSKSDIEKVNASLRVAHERFLRDLHDFNRSMILDRIAVEIKLYRLEQRL